MACTLTTADEFMSATLVGIDTRIATHVAIAPVKAVYGYNLTVAVELEGKLGFTGFIIKVSTNGGTFTSSGSIDVIGASLRQSSVKISERTDIELSVYGGRQNNVSPGECVVSATPAGIIDATIQGGVIVCEPLASGNARVLVDCPSIGYDGESAETELSVEVTGSTAKAATGKVQIVAASLRLLIQAAAPEPLCLLLSGADASSTAFKLKAGPWECALDSVSKKGSFVKTCFILPSHATLAAGTYDMALTYDGGVAAKSASTPKLVIIGSSKFGVSRQILTLHEKLNSLRISWR